MIIIKIHHLKEAFATLVAEVGSFVVVLFPNFDKHEVFFLYFFVLLFRVLLRSPVKDRGISVCEFSSAIFTLVDLSHPVTEKLLSEPMIFFIFDFKRTLTSAASGRSWWQSSFRRTDIARACVCCALDRCALSCCSLA